MVGALLRRGRNHRRVVAGGGQRFFNDGVDAAGETLLCQHRVIGDVGADADDIRFLVQHFVDGGEALRQICQVHVPGNPGFERLFRMARRIGHVGESDDLRLLRIFAEHLHEAGGVDVGDPGDGDFQFLHFQKLPV